MTTTEELQQHKAYLKDNVKKLASTLYCWFYKNEDYKDKFIASFVNNDIEEIEAWKKDLIKFYPQIEGPCWGWDMMPTDDLCAKMEGEFKIVQNYNKAIISLGNTFDKLHDVNEKLKHEESKHIVTAFYKVIELMRELIEQESWGDMIALVEELEKEYVSRESLPS